LLILLFFAGFFSLSLIGLTQNGQGEQPIADSGNVEQVAPMDSDIQQADNTAVNDQQKFNAKKGNILEMKRKSGFRPVTILRGLLGLAVLIFMSFLFSRI